MRFKRGLKPATTLLILCFAGFATRAPSAEVRPRIRAVTAFIEIDANNYEARVQEAQKFLATAKDALNKAGFEGAGGRITTQPFPQYTKGMKPDDAVAFIGRLREAASKERSGLNIGSAMVHDTDDPAAVSLLVDILARVNVNANLITADEQGIHWNAIRQAAKAIKQLSERSPHGDANFNFGAIAMMKPYGPYYPGSYHLGKGHAFAIAMEGAEVVGDVFRQYRDPVEAEKHLSMVLNTYTRQIEAVALQVAKSSGWTYEGIDATPAPLGDRSIATAVENFLGAPFGSVGTESIEESNGVPQVWRRRSEGSGTSYNGFSESFLVGRTGGFLGDGTECSPASGPGARRPAGALLPGHPSPAAESPALHRTAQRPMQPQPDTGR